MPWSRAICHAVLFSKRLCIKILPLRLGLGQQSWVRKTEVLRHRENPYPEGSSTGGKYQDPSSYYVIRMSRQARAGSPSL